MGLETIFKPIKIGTVEIKNRIATAPMNVIFRTNSLPSEEELGYYAARAKGGMGLVIPACIFGTEFGFKDFGCDWFLALYKQEHVYGFARLVELIHDFGAKAFAQMCVVLGKEHHSQPWRPVGPSAIGNPPDRKLLKVLTQFQSVFPLFGGEVIPREMTIEEIRLCQEQYTKSVGYAILAGFDGVEIHSPHGYCMHQFLSPVHNKRTDQYGGSLENRMRFLAELSEKVKKTYPGYPVGVRISAAEHIEGGFTAEDTKIVAARLEEIGLDYIHLSDGSGGDEAMFCSERDNLHILEEAKIIKSGLKKIPVITPQVQTPSVVAEAIEKGQTDMISMGRPSMVDPEWVNKVEAGKIDEINHCRRCNTCQIPLFMQHGIRCKYNPDLGRERYMPEYWPTKRQIYIPDYFKKNLGKFEVKH